jgi:hypothetical protein
VSGPPPPADLAKRSVNVLTLATGTVLHRFFIRTDGISVFDPIYFDRSLASRFNAPDASYGVLYTSHGPHGGFAESFLRTPGRRMIDPGLLARKAYVKLQVLRPLTMIEFDGKRLAPLGATAAVVHGDPPYDNPQAWSKALRDHPTKADGIAYTARHDPSELCYALFDDRDPLVAEVSRDETLDADWFWRLADAYEVGFAP